MLHPHTAGLPTLSNTHDTELRLETLYNVMQQGVAVPGREQENDDTSISPPCCGQLKERLSNPCAHCTVQMPPAGTFWQLTTTTPSPAFVGLQTATNKKCDYRSNLGRRSTS
jgi:hypothetical protein